MKIWIIAMVVGSALFYAGCAGQPQRKTPVPPDAAQKSEREILLTQLVGTWITGTADKQSTAVFDRSGSLIFQGGLANYNPAHWELNAEQKELVIHFPSLSNNQLQIFQLQVGQGVKAFRPNEKRVIFEFTEHTWTLNLAGWEYSKPSTLTLTPAEPEPVFK